MSKPIYFTGRREIARRHVWVRFWDQLEGSPKFDIRLDLSEYRLPADAGIAVEAYHNAYYRRFACGTIAVPDLSRKELDDFEPGDRPKFRIKVIDAMGTLIAVADQIQPETDDSLGVGGSLLPIHLRDQSFMGQELWKVNFIDGGTSPDPVLWINEAVPELYNALRSRSPQVTSLIMPAILREVLRGLVEGPLEWSEDGWLGFAWRLYPFAFNEWDDSEEEKKEVP